MRPSLVLTAGGGPACWTAVEARPWAPAGARALHRCSDIRTDVGVGVHPDPAHLLVGVFVGLQGLHDR